MEYIAYRDLNSVPVHLRWNPHFDACPLEAFQNAQPLDFGRFWRQARDFDLPLDTAVVLEMMDSIDNT